MSDYYSYAIIVIVTSLARQQQKLFDLYGPSRKPFEEAEPNATTIAALEEAERGEFARLWIKWWFQLAGLET